MRIGQSVISDRRERLTACGSFPEENEVNVWRRMAVVNCKLKMYDNWKTKMYRFVHKL